MYKICKTKQSADRQRYISDVLFKMLLRHSIDEISISSLCQKAKIPRKAFYRYFDTLEDVVQYRLDKWKEDYTQFQAERGFTPSESLENNLEQFLLFWEEQSGFLEAIFYNRRLSDLFGKVISSQLSDSNSGNMCEVGFDERLYFGVGGLISLLIWNRNSKNPCSNHQLAAKLTFLMSNALYNPNLSNETFLEGKVKFPSA